jgi:hypothetical protein
MEFRLGVGPALTLSLSLLRGGRYRSEDGPDHCGSLRCPRPLSIDRSRKAPCAYQMPSSSTSIALFQVLFTPYGENVLLVSQQAGRCGLHGRTSVSSVSNEARPRFRRVMPRSGSSLQKLGQSTRLFAAAPTPMAANFGAICEIEHRRSPGSDLTLRMILRPNLPEQRRKNPLMDASFLRSKVQSTSCRFPLLTS